MDPHVSVPEQTIKQRHVEQGNPERMLMRMTKQIMQVFVLIQSTVLHCPVQRQGSNKYNMLLFIHKFVHEVPCFLYIKYNMSGDKLVLNPTSRDRPNLLTKQQ